jgi:hypothetical protein
MATPSIIQLAEAKVRGLSRYFTGVACIRGHISERRTGNRNCVACLVAVNAASYRKIAKRICAEKAEHRRKHREEMIARDRKWYCDNPEKARAKSAKWRRENSDEVRARSAIRRKLNPEKARAHLRKWQIKNPHKMRAMANKRRAMHIEQRCSCCTDKQIEMVYALGGPGVQIDHTISFKLGEVLGIRNLHCRKNLEPLTVEVHAAKTALERRLLVQYARNAVRKAQDGKHV